VPWHDLLDRFFANKPVYDMNTQPIEAFSVDDVYLAPKVEMPDVDESDPKALYEAGLKLIDDMRAFKQVETLLLKAANMNYPPAYSALADLYILHHEKPAERGGAVESRVDYVIKYLKLAAKYDDNAISRLFKFYESVAERTSDPARKAQLRELAYTTALNGAQRGHIDSMIGTAMFLDAGYGVEKNRAAADAWYEKAVEAGSTYAAYQLGMRALGGDGNMATIIPKARYWLTIAANRGDRASIEMLNSLLTDDEIRQKTAVSENPFTVGQ